MVVDKRQRKEKPTKMEQRKVPGLEWEPQVKQTALLASPIYIGQAQGEEKKTYKKRSQNWAPLFFWVSLPSCLKDAFSFTCQIKLSCNKAVTLVRRFKSLLQWNRTEEIIHSPDISGAVSCISPGWNNLSLVPGRWRPSTAKAQLGESSHGRNWTQRNTRAVEVTRSLTC